jgi:hypothetical protein
MLKVVFIIMIIFVYLLFLLCNCILHFHLFYLYMNRMHARYILRVKPDILSPSITFSVYLYICPILFWTTTH